MKFATWNVNGIRARLENIIQWIEESTPDVLCLQEIKVADPLFPLEKFEDLGYNVAVHGQKGFNGVAILSKYPFDEVLLGLAGDPEDEQARYVEAVVSIAGNTVRVSSLYLPNGNPLDSSKFPYKCAWMKRLQNRAKKLLAYEEILLLCGDYNVIPFPRDAYAIEDWRDDALFHPEIREQFLALLALGFTDAVRACNDEEEVYTFWDYKSRAWERNRGIRIDHILLSPQAADLLVETRIDTHTRDWEKPSDHVPVIATLDL